MAYKITNLTGEDFYDCDIYYLPKGCDDPTGFVDTDHLGNFKMGETRMVKQWDGDWYLAGIDRRGNTIGTKVISHCTFRQWDLVDW